MVYVIGQAHENIQHQGISYPPKILHENPPGSAGWQTKKIQGIHD